MKKNICIYPDKPYLILCEGEDEFRFLIAYFNSSSLKDNPAFSEKIQIINFGGNNELENHLQLIQKMENFNTLQSVMVIRDAERDAKTAQREVIQAFQKSGLPVPEKVGVWNSTSDGINTGFLLFPSCSQELKNGTLEDLCLSILKEPDNNRIMEDIEGFMEQLRNNHNRTFPHEFKTKLHTYFSITDKFISLKIGEAAKAGAFDFSHEHLKNLRIFLETVMVEAECN